jgi:hypothetical protein
MEYYEHNNLIFAGKKEPALGDRIRVGYYIVDGKWEDCSVKEGQDARTFGDHVTEEEARKFQGEGWPAAPPPGYES